MNIYTTLFFITISTFTGSLRQILNKKYILQNIASGEYKLLNYFLKFIVSLIFFFFVKKLHYVSFPTATTGGPPATSLEAY